MEERAHVAAAVGKSHSQPQLGPEIQGQSGVHQQEPIALGHTQGWIILHLTVLLTHFSQTWKCGTSNVILQDCTHKGASSFMQSLQINLEEPRSFPWAAAEVVMPLRFSHYPIQVSFDNLAIVIFFFAISFHLLRQKDLGKHRKYNSAFYRRYKMLPITKIPPSTESFTDPLHNTKQLVTYS